MVSCRRPREGGEGDPLKWIVPSRLRKNYGVRENFTGPHVCGNRRTLCRMLKKAVLLTRPAPARLAAKTRLVPCKAAASCHFIRGGRDDPNCAQRSHPPTHWHAETCHLPGRGPSNSLNFYLGSGQGCPLLRASNEHSFTVRVLRARRAPGHSLPILLRPRVARAQKIIRLHPLPALRARRAPGRSRLILLRPRVARARGSSQLPRPLFQHPARARGGGKGHSRSCRWDR